MLRRHLLLAPSALLLRAQDDETGFSPLKDWTIVDGPESAFTIRDGVITVNEFASFPCWLRSARQYKNFELRGEFFIKGWTDSGIYLHAPEHGRPTQAGFQIKVFHQPEEKPASNSMGAILPVVAPKLVSVKPEWNSIRVVFDWPRLRVWTNGALVQDIDCAGNPELRYRLREGYFGIAAVSAVCRFRNLRVKELPSRDRWDWLYEGPEDFAKWQVSEGQPNFVPLGPVLRGDGTGHLRTVEKFRDFELQTYVRAASQHNSGILFRSTGRGLAGEKHYEIQLHNVEEAHFPTGSLYHLKRAKYPRIEDEKWFLMQLRVQGPNCLVRVDGETVMEYENLDILDEGYIELQAHRRGYWTEFKHIRIQRI